MRRVVGIDIHRTFGEVVFWEAGKLQHGRRVDMTRTGLEGLRQEPPNRGRGSGRSDR